MVYLDAAEDHPSVLESSEDHEEENGQSDRDFDGFGAATKCAMAAGQRSAP